MSRILVLFIIISFIATYVPNRIEAFPGTKITKSVGEGVVWTAKGVGKTIYWAGKGMYKVAEYFVVELSSKSCCPWGLYGHVEKVGTLGSPPL